MPKSKHRKKHKQKVQSRRKATKEQKNVVAKEYVDNYYKQEEAKEARRKAVIESYQENEATMSDQLIDASSKFTTDED